MSDNVHLFVLGVAGTMRQRLDVDGLERVREAQLRHQRAKLAANGLRRRKRAQALKAADVRLREDVWAALDSAGSDAKPESI